jgi:hypothetical protein
MWEDAIFLATDFVGTVDEFQRTIDRQSKN